MIGEKQLAWVDRLSPGRALLGGGVVGVVLATVSVAGIGGWIGVGLCGVVLAVAGVVGWRAEPEWKVAEEAPALPKVVEDLGGRLAMVELPGGTFQMGSAWYDRQAYKWERPRHVVTISAFAIGRDVITRKLYREIMGTGREEWQEDGNDDRLPANFVSWFDAIKFCNRLSVQASLEPCYRSEDEALSWNRKANGYRLPTEAEWEYACRAGTTTGYFWGNKIDHLYAWADLSVHQVGEKHPNPWGLHDMAGNVNEWCWDWFGDYSKEAQTDPDGPPTGQSRVLRGGAFWREPRRLRSADRVWSEPVGRREVCGFRVVRASRRPP